MSERRSSVAIVMVLGSCVSLQFGAALATRVFPTSGPWGMSLMRLLLAGLVLALMAPPKLRGWNTTTWRWVLLHGITMGGMNAFFYASIDRIPLGTAVTFEFMGPLVLAAVLSQVPRDAIWVGLAVVGVVLLGVDSLVGITLDPLGIGFALSAGACWAAYILVSRRVGALLSDQSGLAMAFLVGAVLVLPLGWQGATRIMLDPAVLVLALATALMGSLVPYTLELMALRRLPPRVFSILLSLEPAIAAMIGWLMIGQHLGWLQCIAMTCVVIASVGTSRTAAAPLPGIESDEDERSADQPAQA